MILLAASANARVVHAQAASHKLTFTWTAPPECPSENDVRGRVDRILGAHASRDDVDARATVAHEGESFSAEIQLFSAGQTSLRHMSDISCDALTDAVALIVALTVNPDAALETKAAPPKKILVKAAPPPKASHPSEATVPWRPLYLGASLLLDTTTLSAIGVGAEVVGGFNPHHASFEISATWLGAQDAPLAPGSTQGASEFSLGAGARACWEIFDAALDIGPCGGAELAGIFASGFGTTKPEDTGAALFRALLGARAKLRFSRFALRIGAEAASPFTRPSFVIDNAGPVTTVQHVSAATFRTTIGAEIHF